VYGYSYTILSGRTLSSITLPNNLNLGILGMAMVCGLLALKDGRSQPALIQKPGGALGFRSFHLDGHLVELAGEGEGGLVVPADRGA